jgi:hypothetical protein
MSNEYVLVSGMRIGREIEVLGENLPLAPLCPKQITHDLTRDRTRAVSVGSHSFNSMMSNEYVLVSGMRIGREIEVLGENLHLAPLCPKQIPHDLTRDRTRAVSVGSRLHH